MTDELKPVNCGCGGEAKVDTKLVSCTPVERKRVYCSKCYISTEWMKSEAEAVQAWNRAMGADQFREVTKKIERKKEKWQRRKGSDCWECSECHAVLESDDIVRHNYYYCYHCGADMMNEDGYMKLEGTEHE